MGWMLISVPQKQQQTLSCLQVKQRMPCTGQASSQMYEGNHRTFQVDGLSSLSNNQCWPTACLLL